MKILIYTIAFCLFAAMATAQNPNIIRTDSNTYSVGTYGHAFKFDRLIQVSAASALHCDWATCIAMVLNYNGLNVQQDNIMSLVNGPAEEPLSAPQDLMFAINKNTPYAWGKPSKIYCEAATLNADVIFDELAAGRPLIIGTGSTGAEGKAYVVTAMAYSIKRDAGGQQTGITPISVTIRDPAPGGTAGLAITWQSFAGLTASLYTIKVVFKK